MTSDLAPQVVAAAPRLAMVAGEASGDLIAGLALKGLKQHWPGLTSVGIGGPAMAAQGFVAWWPHHKLSVFGYLDALRHLPELLRIRRQLGDRLIRERPSLFVGFDAPDFNFGLETRLRSAGLKTVHFVCPSIWAWRAHRVQKLARAADHVLCLFPFEPALLQSHGIAATFVGHPLADLIPMDPPTAAARAALCVANGTELVALLPGSRRSEIEHIAPRMLAAAALMARQRGGLQFVMPVVPGLESMIEPMLQAQAPGLALSVLQGRSHEALAACDVAMVASGTATLEAALFKRPMVITYCLHWLNWRRMQRMALQPWFGLPNILCEDFVVPELIQDAATPQALADATLAWLDDASRVAQVQARFRELHAVLRQNTAARTADALERLLAGP